MKDHHPERDGHISNRLMAAYVAGECNPGEEYEVEMHCLSCKECCTRIAVLLHLYSETDGVEEPPNAGKNLSTGKEAIRQALQRVSRLASEAVRKNRQADTRRFRFWPLSKFQVGRKQFYILLFVTTVLIISGLLYYRGWWRGPRGQDSLAILYRSYGHSRPLQARITGGFAYRPYERKRGSSATASPEAEKFSEDLVELTRAVATKPTVEARHVLGLFYLLGRDFDKAEVQLTLALEKTPGDARLYTDLGALFYERSYKGDPLLWLSKAVDHYDRALELDPQLAEAWFNRALCHHQMALFSKARADWERYLQIDSDSPWAAEAREGLKRLQNWQQQSTDQNKRVQHQLREAAASNDEQVLHRLVTENFATVSQLATQDLFDEYLRAAVNGESVFASARLRTLTLVGQLVAEIKGDRYIADLVDFVGKANSTERRELQKIRFLLQQGGRENTGGAFDDAFQHFSEAHEMAQRIGDQCHAELAAINLARFYNLRANFHGLEAASKKLIASTESHRHRQLQARALTALANAYINSLRFSRALDLSLEAAKIAKEIDDADTAIIGLVSAGNVYLRMGDYERAEQKNFEAIGLLRDSPLSPFHTARIHANMGETLLLTGNYPRALDYHQEGWQVAEQLNNPGLLAALAGRLGLNYWKLGRQEEAVTQLNDAILRTEAITDRTARLLLQVELYTPLGDFYLRQNEAAKAITAYQQALTILGKTNHRIFLSAIHQGLAAAYRAQGRIAEAEAELQTSIRLAERDRQQIKDARGRSVYLFSRQDVYRAMMEFQSVTKHDSAQAFNYAEISKSRDLLDILTGRIEPGESDGSKTLRVSGSARPLTMKQVQSTLPPNAQLLEYSSGEDRLLIWLVTRDEIFSESIEIKSDRLRRLVKDYLDSLRARADTVLLRRQAVDLYQILISPIAARLDRNRVLCIVPDGILSQLPFGALVSPEPSRYLVEDYALAVNPSASVMARAMAIGSKARKSAGTESFLGLGNPRFNRQRFPELPPLPSAEEEVTRVKPDYPKAQILSREQATESALTRQIGDYDIVHLATHVLINEQSPLLSSIVLAEENHQLSADRLPRKGVFDGSWQAYEIYQLKLARTRLVLLSGCRSALGVYTRGEALSGLVQAFLAAGVPTVIASLWDVDDDSSSDLMRAFHYQYRVKHQNFSESLRQAQCSLIHGADSRRQHPYYWAAFLLAGNGCDSPLKN